MIQNLETMSDEALCQLCSQASQPLEVLLNRHAALVKSATRAFYWADVEQEDLRQEAMVALFHATLHFSPQRDSSFQTFASTCIRHRLVSAIRSAYAQKHRVLSDSLPLRTASFPSSVEKEPWFMQEQSPEELLISKEAFADLQNWLNKALSPLEKQVLELYLKGQSYGAIADTLKKSTKSVDNAIQRIRQKCQKWLLAEPSA